MNARVVLRFTYKNLKGETREREVHSWQEQDDVVIGFDVGRGAVRTFRKDRILAWHDGGDQWLADPHAKTTSRQRRISDAREHILFTGFASSARKELEARATAAKMCPVQSVTNKLAYLCCGSNAGPAKMAKAIDQHALLLTEESFLELISTGALPG